jgi:hypothetical protein
VHLFLLTVFHHHNAEFFQNQPAAIGQESHHTPLAADASLICTTCQIIRHSAMRLTPGAQAPQVAHVVPLRMASLCDDLPSPRRIAIFGRAPPLA